ncbi:agamous-like MADS-box protein AGL61 [Fagus crenata]
MFCFGHPDVETILERYVKGQTYSDSSSQELLVPVDEFNRQYAELQKELEREKMRLAEIEEANKKVENNNVGFWWDKPVDENMGLEELEHYTRALQEMRRRVATKVEEFRMERGSLMQPMNMAMGLGNEFVINWESNACGGFAC